MGVGAARLAGQGAEPQPWAGEVEILAARQENVLRTSPCEATRPPRLLGKALSPWRPGAGVIRGGSPGVWGRNWRMGSRRPSPLKPGGRLWAPSLRSALSLRHNGTCSAPHSSHQLTGDISIRSDQISKSVPGLHSPRLEAQQPHVASGPTRDGRGPRHRQPRRTPCSLCGLIPGSATVGPWARPFASPCLGFPPGKVPRRCPAHSKSPTGRTREHHDPTPPFAETQVKCRLLREVLQAFLSPSRHPALNQRSLSTYYVPGSAGRGSCEAQ